MKKIIFSLILILGIQSQVSLGATLQTLPLDRFEELGQEDELPLLPDLSSQPNTNTMTVPIDQAQSLNNFNVAPRNMFDLNDGDREDQDADPNRNILDKLVNFGSSGDPFNNILNQLFYAGLIIAVILAIIMIIRGGVQYMTIDGGSSKDTAKRRIQAALGGLLLAFSAILILQTINPSLTSFTIGFDKIQKVTNGTEQPTATPSPSIDPNSGQPITALPGQEGNAYMSSINNPDSLRASAQGTITVNGHTYQFISGGGGRGYLPAGIYDVSNGRNRSDVSSMMVDGYGYSFDLSDAYDSRVGGTRTELRIHPDGGNPGTAGCIGIQGGSATQKQFYDDMNTAIRNGGGSYKIKVGN